MNWKRVAAASWSNLQPSLPIKKNETSDSNSRPRKATIYDLARVAGVSPGTVSRVLNNRDRVKAETREKVLSAATKLRLRPQASVRLRQIALITDPGYSDRIEGYAATVTAHLSFALSRRNIGVVIPNNPEEELSGLYLDGVIAITYNEALRQVLSRLEERTHIVYLDRFDVVATQNVVCSDHYRAGYLAAQHFIARGKQRLAFLGRDLEPFRVRLQGFRAAMEEAGIAPDDRRLSLVGSSHNSTSVLSRLVKLDADALYVPGTSYQALDCLHMLTYVMGKRIPEDIGLIGGENEGISASLNPPLTTIDESLRDLAENAAAMLDRLTSHQTVTARRVVVPVSLIERDSV
ncbi:LacI family DNA-binding transcriptional regulator [Synoicihabitans lomoniglobus]|uniref:LacI family DNA-binding transcriptional regulator n=1 Tax=Synoicihabitans lomoniglobus TaxID=2909285 RepID=A0AAF0CP01_9BACT|nr:LacI family transcriptional regulator [Opitutaceae bacterium LMO-M01]WED65346.1 LacI family DNA-binding transcriptional regulator [Opitutaceae bacterium LMO-M01]